MTTPGEESDKDASTSREDQPEDTPGQLSEGGGALTDDETALTGADAVPDKTTGTAGDNRER